VQEGRIEETAREAPEEEPGSVITVPAKDPADRLDLRGLIADIVAITSSLVTVIVIVTR
jgi:hypothetical protein